MKQVQVFFGHVWFLIQRFAVWLFNSLRYLLIQLIDFSKYAWKQKIIRSILFELGMLVVASFLASQYLHKNWFSFMLFSPNMWTFAGSYIGGYIVCLTMTKRMPKDRSEWIFRIIFWFILYQITGNVVSGLVHQVHSRSIFDWGFILGCIAAVVFQNLKKHFR